MPATGRLSFLNQFGVLSPGGAERAAHLIRQEHLSGSNVLTIDMRNAFNTPLRSELADALLSHHQLHAFIPLFELEYGRQSELLFFHEGRHNSTIPSSCGVKQGSPTAGFFFCLLILQLKLIMKDFPSVKFFAYMDDITLTSADLGALENATKALEAKANSFNLLFNHKKCEFFASGNATTPPALAMQGFKQVSGCIKVLGVYIGESEALKGKLLERHSREFRASGHDI
jgi:hypothetical protein